VIKLSAHDAPAELRAIALALRAATKDVRTNANQRMRATMNPAWQSEATHHLTGSSRLESRLLIAGVRINAGNPPVLVAANSRKRVGRGDLTPTDDWQIVEFGSHGTKRSEMKSRKGTKYTRRTTTGLPRFTKGGRVLYPAAASILPRIAAWYAQSVIRAYMDALDGGKRG
jgi:hypothetical protein